jgi:hypothetical protein
MKRIVSMPALAIGLLAVAGLAQADTPNPDRMNNGKSVFGEAVAATQDTRVVNVAKQNSLEVACGDVVTFQNGSKTFSWKFDTMRHSAVDLQKIAPAGFFAKTFKVYVSRNEGETS